MTKGDLVCVSAASGFSAPVGTTTGLLLSATDGQQDRRRRPAAAARSSTPVEAKELRETWNDRVSQGPPVGAFPEFEGWSMGAAMPLPRSEHAVAEFDGKIWVLGGYPPGRLPSNLVQVYDPATSRWSLGPTLPQPIHHTHVAAVGGKLYMIGGEIDGASTGKPEEFVADTWVHDPAVGGWAKRAPMPTARSGGGKAVIDGKIYVAGGRPPGGSAFEVYDPATDRGKSSPTCRASAITSRWSRSAARSTSPAAAPARARWPSGSTSSKSTIPGPANGARARCFRRRAAGSPARPTPAACSSSAARASGPMCSA